MRNAPQAKCLVSNYWNVIVCKICSNCNNYKINIQIVRNSNIQMWLEKSMIEHKWRLTWKINRMYRPQKNRYRKREKNIYIFLRKTQSSLLKKLVVLYIFENTTIEKSKYISWSLSEKIGAKLSRYELLGRSVCYP